MTDEQPREDFYQEIPSKVGLYFICLVSGAFGAMFTLGALSRSMRDADDWLLLVIGLVAIAFTIRLYQISVWPSFSLTANELIVRRWLGTRRLLYSDIQSLAEYSKWTIPARVRPAPAAKPFLLHYLIVTLRSGKTIEFPLPTYRGNRDLLQALSQRTNLQIESQGTSNGRQ